ncbi:glutamate synthase (NADPH/NADH) large chain [Parageobacillus thermantarcticus]|uniref:Glutamate synthase (NADPH/NADH) large chain n=1 Tax=Parageobacillus thermantarcticus TaxID=186116 RepID=A0A1I0TFE8_9BACL|nr:glutamate synthase (NADPH/NADH) large chain [Parageobacillus thermantarcticus]
MACIDALVKMNHRAGFINGEGDGVGIHMDIPKKLWMEKLANVGQNPEIANDESFTVGHLFINRSADVDHIKSQIKQLFKKSGFLLIFESDRVTSSNALGPIALRQEPAFWQVALLPNDNVQLSKRLFDLLIEIEKNENVHVASLSNFHVVYKVMGAGDILPKYYHDLAHPFIASTMTLGHNRYSTNTLSNFFRVQPFSVLAHNGEINTIAKLRDEAAMIGVPLTNGGSDSQDLSRTIETLICRYGYSLFEAMDILFPPIVNEIKAYPEHLQDLYTYIREAWGHFAQGPAAIISRHADEAVFSVDALGLRPLWKLETEKRFVFTSEPGIIPASEYTGEPKPLAPGEKIGLTWSGDVIQVLEYEQFQEEVYTRFSKRFDITNFRKRLDVPKLENHVFAFAPTKVHNGQYAAFGWDREHIQLLEQMAEKGVEPIRSLGHDAPLAAMDPNRKNLADFIKESVAVVTNPAIDRDREMEHFSTRTVIGKRPSLIAETEASYVIELSSPILIEGKIGNDCAPQLHHPSYDQVVHSFQKKTISAHPVGDVHGRRNHPAGATTPF